MWVYQSLGMAYPLHVYNTTRMQYNFMVITLNKDTRFEAPGHGGANRIIRGGSRSAASQGPCLVRGGLGLAKEPGTIAWLESHSVLMPPAMCSRTGSIHY